MAWFPAPCSVLLARQRGFIRALLTGGALLWGLGPLHAASPSTCQRSAAPQPLAIVELYTSEGCSSCPPADRWLSTLKTQEGVLALAFHVNYWNHLGWSDRYASAQTTARQYRIKEALGQPYVYTPQVLVNGRDVRDWSGQTARSLAGLPADAAPALSLSREGDEVIARVAGTASRQIIAGYWAVLGDGLSSQVTRGENAGAHLRHDHVVSLYQPVAAWSAAQPQILHLHWPAVAGTRVAFVVTDRSGIRPLQGLDLPCP